MSTCKDCFHYEACSGFTPTDLDQDVFDYCRKGIADEIPDIEERCNEFMDKANVVEVVRCKDCVHWENGYGFCKKAGVDCYGGSRFGANSFCSDGKRREE